MMMKIKSMIINLTMNMFYKFNKIIPSWRMILTSKSLKPKRTMFNVHLRTWRIRRSWHSEKILTGMMLLKRLSKRKCPIFSRLQRTRHPESFCLSTLTVSLRENIKENYHQSILKNRNDVIGVVVLNWLY